MIAIVSLVAAAVVMFIAANHRSSLPVQAATTADILSVNNDPGRYAHRRIRLSGRVEEVLAAPDLVDYKLYTLRDSTGTIAVMTRIFTPFPKEQHVAEGCLTYFGAVGKEVAGFRLQEGQERCQ